MILNYIYHYGTYRYRESRSLLKKILSRLDSKQGGASALQWLVGLRPPALELLTQMPPLFGIESTQDL